MENTLTHPVRETRRQDIIDSFFHTLKEMRKTRPFITQNEVIEQAAKGSAPRFYVTFENARRFVSLLMRGKPLPITNRNKIAMYKEIYRRYKAREKNCDNRYKYVILEDIIEELVGNIFDEYDEEEKEFEKIDDNTYILSGSMTIYDVNKLLESNIPEGYYDTLSGYLQEELGRIPKERPSFGRLRMGNARSLGRNG